MAEPTEMKHVISLGAGVQSSTMALMAAHGEITPMPVAAIFADTQAEPRSVYEWLDWLETKLPFPVIRVSKGNLANESTRVRVSKKSGNQYLKHLPPAFTVSGDKIGMLPRHCTLDFKVQVIVRELRRIRGTDEKITQWIGISRDEAHRMKPARPGWLTSIWPLVDLRMTRADCLQWMSSRGYPLPPRSACYFCPYHSDAEWMRLRDSEPEAFAAAIDYERKLSASVTSMTSLRASGAFLHRTCKPLSEVDFDSLAVNKQVSLFGEECEGMCGV